MIFSRAISGLALALAVVVPGRPARAVEPSSRPNILFLLSDDQRADTIAALGNPAIKTPALDRLANSGFVFRNAYCLGANEPAVCCPSRNMLLSGRSYFRWKGRHAPAADPNFPDALKAVGYETYHHGKLGNTAVEIQKHFDHNIYLNDDQDRLSGEPGKTIVDAAIKFLETRRPEKPFFMYLAFANPHDPRVAAPRHLNQYETNSVPLPKDYLPAHPFDNGEMTVRDETLAPWPREPEEIRRELREYYAVITGLDYHAGRLLDALDALKLSRNTIIIYSSDHGLALGSHGLLGKQSLYEAAMKPPLIFAGPGIPKGQTRALVYLMDIFPTVCELAGAPAPPGLDGRSLAGIIRGQTARVRDTLFLAYRESQRAVRDERWKLIRYPLVNVTQLFDLERDPCETADLSGDPAQADRIRLLTGRLREWQKELGDTAPLSVEHPKPAAWTPPAAKP